MFWGMDIYFSIHVNDTSFWYNTRYFSDIVIDATILWQSNGTYIIIIHIKSSFAIEKHTPPNSKDDVKPLKCNPEEAVVFRVDMARDIFNVAFNMEKIYVKVHVRFHAFLYAEIYFNVTLR